MCDHELLSTEFEVVWCKIRCGLDLVLVGCFYRPPGAPSSVCNEMCRLIRNATNEVEKKKYTALVIAGDFNFPIVE